MTLIEASQYIRATVPTAKVIPRLSGIPAYKT